MDHAQGLTHTKIRQARKDVTPVRRDMVVTDATLALLAFRIADATPTMRAKVLPYPMKRLPRTTWSKSGHLRVRTIPQTISRGHSKLRSMSINLKKPV